MDNQIRNDIAAYQKKIEEMALHMTSLHELHMRQIQNIWTVIQHLLRRSNEIDPSVSLDAALASAATLVQGVQEGDREVVLVYHPYPAIRPTMSGPYSCLVSSYDGVYAMRLMYSALSQDFDVSPLDEVDDTIIAWADDDISDDLAKHFVSLSKEKQKVK